MAASDPLVRRRRRKKKKKSKKKERKEEEGQMRELISQMKAGCFRLRAVKIKAQAVFSTRA